MRVWKVVGFCGKHFWETVAATAKATNAFSLLNWNLSYYVFFFFCAPLSCFFLYIHIHKFEEREERKLTCIVIGPKMASVNVSKETTTCKRLRRSACDWRSPACPAHHHSCQFRAVCASFLSTATRGCSGLQEYFHNTNGYKKRRKILPVGKNIRFHQRDTAALRIIYYDILYEKYPIRYELKWT